MIPILTYHAIGDGPAPLWLSASAFEAELDALTRVGYRTMSLGEIAASIARGTLPERRFAITFDDGYANVLENAWLRLRDRGLGATVFVVSDRAGGDNRWRGQPASVPTARLLSWNEIARLAEEGCAIGSHTRSHRVLKGIDRAIMEDEIVGSCERIESETGRRAAAFAYPYGLVSDDALAMVRLHYAAAVTTELRGVVAGDDPHRLPRVDACTIGPTTLRMAGSAAFAGYLSVRRVLRSVRRTVAMDWDPASMNDDER